MPKPKCILINGFAGVGKTTIAKRYIDEHPLALTIEGDRIIVLLGQWLTHEKEARAMIFEHTKGMAATQLALGKDVILSYLLTDASHAEAFEKIAEVHNAEFREVFLEVSKEESVARLLERGTWGEEGLPPLSEKDMPSINDLYERMTRALIERPHTKKIPVAKGDIAHTYAQFLEAIT